MSFQLQWTIEGEQQLSRKLLGLSMKSQDLSGPFKEAADKLVRVFSRDVFTSKGAVIGEKWERLSPRTVASKARRGQSADPLVATGRMKRSFKSLVSTNQAVIYNEAEYFKYHQSKEPRKRLPRRVMMKLHDPQKEMVVRIFQQHLNIK